MANEAEETGRFLLINYNKSKPDTGNGDSSYFIEKVSELTFDEAKSRNLVFAYNESPVRYINKKDFDEVLLGVLPQDAPQAFIEESWVSTWEEPQGEEVEQSKPKKRRGKKKRQSKKKRLTKKK